MKILITGGTTFVSKYVANYYVEQGHEVTVLNRGNKPQILGVTLIKADRHVPGEQLKTKKYDAVLDITPYTKKDVENLLAALGDYGTYIMISSSAVYPEYLPQPFKENAPCGPNAIWGDYGVNKLAAEQYLFEHAKNAYVLRPPYLYGPMENLYRAPFVFECADKGQKFYLPKQGEMKLQFFHVRDLCHMMDAIIEKQPQNQIYNVGNPKLVTIAEWVKLCYQAAGADVTFVNVAAEVEQRAYFPFYNYEYQLDVAEQTKLLNEVTPLEQGILEEYQWYHENPKEAQREIRRKPFFEYIAQNFTN